MTTITKRFTVFDSDSHVVEPPELWEKYLDPEFRALGKQALWRHDGATNSYLKINGEVIRDTMNPNLPRHAIWRPGMTWDDDRRARRERAPSDERGRVGPARAAGRHGRDGRRPGVPVSDLVRRGLPSGHRSGHRLCARARL